MNRITSNHFAMGVALGLQIPMAAFSAGSDSATPSAPQVEAMEYNLSLSDLMNLKVVTASKAEEPIDEAPNVMYVISREDIRRRGYKSLKDIFQIIPGFGIAHKDIQVVGQVRGIAPNDNEKFALMVNGHIINQLTEPDFFQGGGFPLDNLESIEVIVGPGGVFYGGETLCAILNLITRKADGNELAVSAGSGYKTHGDGALPSRDVQYMVGKTLGDNARLFASGAYYARGGYEAWRANSANTSNAALAGLDNVTERVLPSYTMFIGSELDNWSGQFFSQNSQMPDLHDVSTGIKDARRTDYIYSAGIKNKAEWGQGWSTSMELNGDLKRMLRVIDEVGPNTSMDGSNNDLDLSLTSYSAEVAVQHEIPDKNFFQLGFQGVEKQIRHNYDFVWDPDKPYTFYSHRRDSLGNLLDSMRLDKMRAIVKPSETHAAGMYVSNKFKVNRYLKIITALRLDRDEILDAGNTLFFDADKLYLSPRLAAIVTPASDLVLKLMYNRATRLAQAPQATPLNNIWGIENRGLGPDWATQNPTISRPEILNTWEAQLIYYAYDSRLTLNY